ncbi:MAG TPA: hypothetical protein VH593_29235 [Ktedonobacteraceae bacterium]
MSLHELMPGVSTNKLSRPLLFSGFDLGKLLLTTAWLPPSGSTLEVLIQVAGLDFPDAIYLVAFQSSSKYGGSEADRSDVLTMPTFGPLTRLL